MLSGGIGRVRSTEGLDGGSPIPVPSYFWGLSSQLMGIQTLSTGRVRSPHSKLVQSGLSGSGVHNGRDD